MNIEKGRDWGRPTERQPGDRRVDSDAALFEVVNERADMPFARVALNGGDLWRTLGSPRRIRDSDRGCIEAEVDVWIVRFGEETRRFVSHAVLRRRLWRGHSLVAMNSAFLGDANLAPRAHPGDGTLDVLFVSMPWQQRLLARRRARAGTHVPHPDIDMRRMSHLRAESPPRAVLRLDGVAFGTIDSIEIERDPRPLRLVF